MNETMKNYVCEICGGDLREIGEGHFQCPYCRTEYFKETSLPDELVLDLHSANRERSLQRFEDALSEYDRIIAAYPDCFDAYWGATLSDYGIQYEKDYDGKMIPTVHRFSEIPVFENGYYKNAVKFCKNEGELSRIEKSAEEIEKIRAEIKKTVGSQEPYDIFLCYKESPIDGSGGFTPEFYWANDLYIKLSGAGHRVFFAKESLPAAKGDYEAHIFPALRSAKLMLILTTDVRHVESVWVKNEWSRFLRFSKENPLDGKRFKVIYRGFKPEQLPRELRKEQALNQDSIDWAKQLFSVVEDTFRDKKKEEEERRKREADEQAARFARMLEEERKKWAAEAQKSQDEERARREAEDKKKRDDEARKTAEENERRAKEDERIRELERRLTEERKRTEAPVQTTSAPTVTVTNVSAPSTSAALQTTSTAPQTPVAPAVDEKTVSFGSYPQDKVTDATLIDTLNRLAGKLPTKTNSNGWTPYKYIWGRGSTAKLMWYTDITYEGEKYRGVYFVAYRSLTPNAQRDNGYGINTAYWFKFQPVLWKTLEEKSGKKLLLSTKVIDSQQFYHSDAARRSGSGSIYPNNYEKSDVRAWLNGSFIEAAFNETENSKIVTTAVSCAASTTAATPNKFAGGSVKDKLFLLSFKETANADYGFLADALRKDTARAKAVTDYALCQGASARNGNACWWLRSPNASLGENALYVDDTGFSGSARSTEDVVCGIVPAMWIDLDGEGKKPIKKVEQDTENAPEKTEKAATVSSKPNPDYPKVGEIIKLGKYRYSDKVDSLKATEWQVLDVKNNRALVISKFALTSARFQDDLGAVTWETCTMRSWLNGDFMNTIFSADEIAAIPTVTVSAHKNPSFPLSSGKPTEDKLFVLSAKEAGEYFKNKKAAICKATTYAAKAKGALTNIDGTCRWWLRTIGEKSGRLAYVSYYGDIMHRGEANNCTGIAVRPAMWIDLDAYLTLTKDKGEKTKKTDPKVTSDEKIPAAPEKAETKKIDDEKKYVTLTKTLKDGLYTGEAIGDVPNGNGSMAYHNGDHYSGEWKDGKPHGEGLMKYKIIGSYNGSWAAGKKNGKGKLTLSGDVYECNFLNDNIWGAGKLIYKNGDVYEGHFSNNLPSGNGRMFSSDGDYKGEWKNGQKHGKGTYTYKSGAVYEGDWENGRKNGNGKYSYPGGNVYVGEFLNDEKRGNGTLKFANGDVFEGTWEENKIKGVMTYKDGKKAKGKLVDGVFKKTLF